MSSRSDLNYHALPGHHAQFGPISRPSINESVGVAWSVAHTTSCRSSPPLSPTTSLSSSSRSALALTSPLVIKHCCSLSAQDDQKRSNLDVLSEFSSNNPPEDIITARNNKCGNGSSRYQQPPLSGASLNSCTEFEKPQQIELAKEKPHYSDHNGAGNGKCAPREQQADRTVRSDRQVVEQRGLLFTKPGLQQQYSTAVDVARVAACGGTLVHNRLQQLEQPPQKPRLQQQQHQFGDQRDRSSFEVEEERAMRTNRLLQNCSGQARTSASDTATGQIGNERQRKTIQSSRERNYHCDGATAAIFATPLSMVEVEDNGGDHLGRVEHRTEDYTASPTSTLNGNKPCTYWTRLQLTSDTKPSGSTTDAAVANSLVRPSYTVVPQCDHAYNDQHKQHHCVNLSSSCSDIEAQNRSSGESDPPFEDNSTPCTQAGSPLTDSKTASPSDLRAKQHHNTSHPHRHNFEASQLLPKECSRHSENGKCRGSHSVGVTSSASGFVGWLELRNKLIKIKRKSTQHKKRKRNWTLSLPSASSSSSGRLVINRGLLQEFRNRFRRGSNPSSLFYFDNPTSSDSSSVNYSYSYYNFFYYPSRDLNCGSFGQVNKTESTKVKTAPLDQRPARTTPTTVNPFRWSGSSCDSECDIHHYHRLHQHLPTSSLTSLLSISSSSASTSDSSGECCLHHYSCAVSELTPETKQLLPSSTSPVNTQSRHNHYRRFPFGQRHHHHHHHNHHNSQYSSLLDSDPKLYLDEVSSSSTPTSDSPGGTFHHHRPSASNPNTCLSTIMEILPLLLLLTMGVIISTTCAKYTFHSSTSTKTPSMSAAYHHHLADQSDSSSRSTSNDDSAVSSGNGPDPPYLMMMQNDDEYSASHAFTPDSRSSIESSDSSAVVDDSMKKSSTSRAFITHQKHQHNQPNNPQHLHQQQLLAQLAHQYSAMQLRWLSNDTVTCNDGTRAGFYIRHSPSSRRWLIYLEGGWYCMSKSTCDQRWSKMREYMTSFRWTQYKAFNGILSSSPSINPYWWDANHVFIPYCSSDIWSGNSAEPNGMAFQGSRIIDEVVKDLIRSPVYKFNDAKFVLMAGSSAGAAGVMINLDRVARTIGESGSKADVRGLADSGWILENDYLEQMITGNGKQQQKSKQSQPGKLHSPPCTDAAANCSPMESIRGAFKLWNSRVPEACVERFPNEPWRCFFGYRLYPSLQTPLFVVQYQYDEFQIHVDGMTRGRMWNEHERLQYIRSLSDAIRSTLANVTAVFAPSCMSHVVLTKPDWHKVAIKGVTLPDALHCWEEMPMVNRFRINPYSQMYSQYHQLHQFNQQQFKNGYYDNKSSGYYQPPGSPSGVSSKLFKTMYPYGMPVVTSSTANTGGGGSGTNTADISVDLDNDDELSQFYLNARSMHFNYPNSAASSGTNKKNVTPGNNNYFNNMHMSDEMMSNDQPRMSSSESTKLSSDASDMKSLSSTKLSTTSAKSGTTSEMDNVKSTIPNDENSIIVVNGSINAQYHKSLMSSGPSTLLAGSNSTHNGHSHHNHNKKQDKKRKKRKRRKHLHRRMHQSSTTPVPSLTNSMNSLKPKRNPSLLDDNQIKLSPSQPLGSMYQNDGATGQSQHPSRSKKHRPNRMSTMPYHNPFELGTGAKPNLFNEPWNLSGGDEGMSSESPIQPKCHIRLVDDYIYPKTNAFGCPSFFKD